MKTREEIEEQIKAWESAREKASAGTISRRGYILARIQGYIDALKWVL